jgi:hypothetical protein
MSLIFIIDSVQKVQGEKEGLGAVWSVALSVLGVVTVIDYIIAAIRR